ncbi:MAG: hypothetical protein HYR51_20755 [Candidatus Rokubacteria bacterium]|nr:hypothetical protein [Candidatus Rokubacteria bacterium]
MDTIFDVLSILISLAFLGILGLISGVLLPGLFLAVVAPWLDWILPARRKDGARRPSERTT